MTCVFTVASPRGGVPSDVTLDEAARNRGSEQLELNNRVQIALLAHDAGDA